MEFETVIGLEVHAQLVTRSKMFCGTSAEFGHEPNELIDPVTLALPGALPVVNRRAVEFAIMLGIATGCEIRRVNRFARKHYFYPDLPKGYQISQYDEPICERGSLLLHLKDVARTIGITRIHMEEDAGKNIHDSRSGTSLVDLNRSGVPLLEIVSQPDLRTPAEAAEYLRTLRKILRFLGICDGNMEEGSLRCDANVSVRPLGDTKLGTRAEIKNINSFKFVERAIEYEVARQIQIVRAGGTVAQETRLFDSSNGTTHTLRTKESSADYRYFPDPDLPPLVIEPSWVQQIREVMPLLPEEARTKLIESYGLTSYDADILTSERDVYDYYEQLFTVCSNAKAAANWMTTELFGLLNKSGKQLKDSPVSAINLGELVKLIDAEVISGKMAKQVFEEMFSSGRPPIEIVEQRGLKQITDPVQIREIVLRVLDQNPTQLATYLGGNERLLPFFIGQSMKAGGNAINPKLLEQILRNELNALKGNSR